MTRSAKRCERWATTSGLRGAFYCYAAPKSTASGRHEGGVAVAHDAAAKPGGMMDESSLDSYARPTGDARSPGVAKDGAMDVM